MSDVPRDGFLSRIYGGEPDYLILPAIRAALPLLVRQYPDVEPTFVSLANRGDSSGTQAVQDFLQYALEELSNIISFTHDPDYWKLSYEGAEFIELLHRSWAVGAVRATLTDDVSDRVMYDDDILDQMNLMLRLVYDTGARPQRTRDTDYWRGATILYRIQKTNPFHFLTLDEQGDAIEFVEWSGKQSDTNFIIDTVLSRRTLNVSTIRELIALGAKTPALKEGAL